LLFVEKVLRIFTSSNNRESSIETAPETADIKPS
jgi:hypothetical protein